MATIIVIESKKENPFIVEAKTILEANKFTEIANLSFIGTKTGSAIAQELKNLESYKKHKSASGIAIHFGTVTKA